MWTSSVVFASSKRLRRYEQWSGQPSSAGLPRLTLGLVAAILWSCLIYVVADSPTVHDHSSPDYYHSSDTACQKVEGIQWLKRLDWKARTKPLEALLLSYRARHEACVKIDNGLPGNYIRVTSNSDLGIGNTLPSVITGFVLALVMERCLFIDFPFYEDFFEPELDFSWGNHHDRLLAAGHDTREEANIPKRINSEHSAGYKEIADTWLFKNLTEEFQHSYGVELWLDFDWTAALLQSNPYHKEFVDLYFPTREIFAALSPFMLRVTPRLQDRITAFKQQNFGLFTIGLQIRRQKCESLSDDMMEAMDMHCALRPSIESFCAMAVSIQLSHGLHDKDVRFFLAADNEEVYHQVSEILGRERVIFTDNGIAPLTHVDHLQHTPSNNPGTLESGLMDMALLSQCDDIVMTITSSFGYIAAAWGGIAPVHMVYGKHLSARNPYWYRAITSEPCYFEAKDLMQAISKEGLERFKSNPFWMQYSQCHHGAPDLLTAPSWR